MRRKEGTREGGKTYNHCLKNVGIDGRENKSEGSGLVKDKLLSPRLGVWQQLWGDDLLWRTVEGGDSEGDGEGRREGGGEFARVAG